MVDIKEVLNQVNKLRVALGMNPLEDLPKGMKYRTDACPIAESLPPRWYVGTDVIMAPMAGISSEESNLVIANWGSVDEILTEENDIFLNPPIIKQFIDEFDRDMWPEYIDEEGELEDII